MHTYIRGLVIGGAMIIVLRMPPVELVLRVVVARPTRRTFGE